MRFIDKLILKLFSLLIFVLSIVIILVMTGILDVNEILSQIEIYLEGDTGLAVILGILAVLMLLSIKGFFFTSKNTDNAKDGIILENTSGKLVITKESLENLIASAAKDIPGADSISSKTVLDRNKNLIIYITAVVSKDVMIKDISNQLQERIKTAMKKTADLDVKEVNIKIKNITSKKVKGISNVAPEEENKTENTMPEESNEEVNKQENVVEENKEE